MPESSMLLTILSVPLLGAVGVAAFSKGTGNVARLVAMTAMLIVLVIALRIFFS